MSLYVIPGDKANHLVYGTAIAAAASVLTGLLMPYLSHAQRGFLGAVAAVLAGVFKEHLDSRANRKAIAAGLPPPHEVSEADVCWTSAGGVVFVILSNL